MALYIHKYGGTSVASLSKIKNIAKNIAEESKAGHQLVVVVSAMAGETDRLVSLASSITCNPKPREFDVLLSTGEQITIALLTMALQEEGCDARSFTGWQAGIKTDDNHTKAKIKEVDSKAIKAAIVRGEIAIVAGFQGISAINEITTLSRGGSDTTAVALAAELNACECKIYTDVSGVYDIDPNLSEDATLLSHISYETMLLLSEQGAKVLQYDAVQMAKRMHVPVRVLNAHKKSVGTIISNCKDIPFNSIACIKNKILVKIGNISNEKHISVLDTLDYSCFRYEIIEEQNHLLLLVDEAARIVLERHLEKLDITYSIMPKMAKITLISTKNSNQPACVDSFTNVLGHIGIKPLHYSQSEAKVSAILDEKDIEVGIRALHQAI